MSTVVHETLKLLHNVPLQTLHTFASEHWADSVIEMTEQAQLKPLIEKLPTLNKPIKVLGGGSNVVFTQDFPGTLLLNRIKGRELMSINREKKTQCWRVSGGENWHEWVRSTVLLDLSGLENLALIPGTVGAAPIQNIGAYGVEMSQACVGLTALHLKSGHQQYFSGEDCAFGYRDSFFKRATEKDNWFILSVDFNLSENFEPNLSYAPLHQACPSPAHPKDVFEAVCNIRRRKLPDPAVQPNVGSFFKNPVLPLDQAQFCLRSLPQIPRYEVGPGLVKLPAAYLIEAAGLKGFVLDEVGVSDRHALVLVRLQPGSGGSVLALAKYIQRVIRDKFKVNLEIEPQLWGARKS